MWFKDKRYMYNYNKYGRIQKNTKLSISIKNNGISRTNTKTIFHTFRESRHIIRTLFYKKHLPGIQKGA